MNENLNAGVLSNIEKQYCKNVLWLFLFIPGENNVLNINTIKQPQYKILESPVIDNNKRKFAFLSTETVPDYRPKEQRIEKSQKTSSNQSTKFQQLQQKFELNNRNITYIKEINGIEDDNVLTTDVSSNFLFIYISMYVFFWNWSRICRGSSESKQGSRRCWAESKFTLKCRTWIWFCKVKNIWKVSIVVAHSTKVLWEAYFGTYRFFYIR